MPKPRRKDLYASEQLRQALSIAWVYPSDQVTRAWPVVPVNQHNQSRFQANTMTWTTEICAQSLQPVSFQTVNRDPIPDIMESIATFHGLLMSNTTFSESWRACIAGSIVQHSWIARIQKSCTVEVSLPSRHASNTTVSQTVVNASLRCNRIVKRHTYTSRRPTGIRNPAKIVGVLAIIDAVFNVEGDKRLERRAGER